MSTPSSNAPKLLLPLVKDTWSTGTAHRLSTTLTTPELSLLSANTAPQPRRKAKAPRKTREQWETQRTNIHQLYIVEDLSLGDVMKAMDDNHNFQASYVAACLSRYCLFRFSSHQSRRIQYGSKLKEWGFEKYIKEKDMRYIARKKIQRQNEDASKASVFRLRKRPVAEQRVERYIKDKGIDENTVFSDARGLMQSASVSVGG